jgi:hypothetical protein
MRGRLATASTILAGVPGIIAPVARAATFKELPAALGEKIATLTAASPVSAGQGWLIWSAPQNSGEWTLDAYHAGRVSVLPIRPRAEPFDATVGSDAHGRAVATFSRCTNTPRMNGTDGEGGMRVVPSSGRGCSTHVLELASGRESLVPIPRPSGASDTTPAMWHGIVAFARMEPVHGLVSQILTWSPRHPRALLALPHGFVPSECSFQPSCKGYFGYGEVQALAYDGALVAFVWEPKESTPRLHEEWEYRLDTVSSRSGRVVGGAGTSESCMGFTLVEEEHPGTPFLLGTTAYFPGVQRGNCYRRYGSRMLVARPGERLEATLSTPILAWAGAGNATYALVAQVPTIEVEAGCSSATPCTLQRAALPALSPAQYQPVHALG